MYTIVFHANNTRCRRPARASQLAKGYDERVTNVREQLRSNAILGAPRIVGIDWRLDHTIESSASGSTIFVILFPNLI